MNGLQLILLAKVVFVTRSKRCENLLNFPVCHALLFGLAELGLVA
jgi:hypothetical protein